MDISRAIDRIRERNKRPRIRKTLKISWGEPPELSKWGEKQMEVRSKINGKLFSWKIRGEKEFLELLMLKFLN